MGLTVGASRLGLGMLLAGEAQEEIPRDGAMDYDQVMAAILKWLEMSKEVH